VVFSQEIPSQSLGFIDAHASSLEISVAGYDLTIHQSPGLLNSTRKEGTTGAGRPHFLTSHCHSACIKLLPFLFWLFRAYHLSKDMHHQDADIRNISYTKLIKLHARPFAPTSTLSNPMFPENPH
jgi:hypothetical protein